MIRDLYGVKDYRDFLRSELDSERFGKGARTRLAGHLRVQSSLVSLVLTKRQHFSMESAPAISDFLGLSESESEYFILLMSRARAGSKRLEAHYDRLIEREAKRRERVDSRVQAKNALNETSRHEYYSSWNHLVVHLLLLNPAFRDLPALARAARLSAEETMASLKVLQKIGLVRRKANEWVPTEARVHSGESTPALRVHHLNTRMAAVRSLDRIEDDDFHFSGGLSIDRETARKIRALLLESIGKMDPWVSGARDEEVYAIAMDFFRLKPGV